jgi:hypothetical protein
MLATKYIVDKLNEGFYIAEHGRFQSSTGRRGAIVGGYSLMNPDGNVTYDLKQLDMNKVHDVIELIPFHWGDKHGQGGGTEWRTKEWHKKEFS